jgi:hypothetical protein
MPCIGAEVFIGDLLTYGLPNAIAALFNGVSVVYVFRTLRSLVWCSYKMAGDQ